MTSFVQNAYPSKHSGVVRTGQALTHLRDLASRGPARHGVVVLLLAVMVSALLVVMHQVFDSWIDGHFLAAWMLLWLMALASMVLLAAPAHRAELTLRAGYKAWEESRRQDAEDERTWALALQDARVMADRARVMEANAPRGSAP